MRKFEKILEEIEKAKREPWYRLNNHDVKHKLDGAINRIVEIIRKHMSGKDTNVSTNDGWIPVKKEWPPFGQRLQATILHHEWVSDYNSAWVPEEEKNHHPAYTEVCEIYPIGALWCYNCAEDDYNGDVAYIEPAKCLSRPVAEIIAWQPLPEPYHPERRIQNGNR